MTDIRLATADDVSTIEDLVRAAYQPWAERIGARPRPLDADYAVLVDAGQVYVTGADIDGVLVIADEPSVMFLDNIAVSPTTQHQGIGKRLVAFALDHARETGAARVLLYTHSLMTDNVAWYASLGFEVTAREPMGAGERVHMTKQL